MPNRLIKESLCTSERINQLSDFHFRLWACLITYVDDYGRGDARAAIIKGRCFPLRDKVTVKDIEAGLYELAAVGCVVLYRVDDGLFLCFPNWEKHQTVRNQKSKYPSPDDGELVEIAGNCMQLNSIECKSSRNPIQSESNPNPNPNPMEGMFERFWTAYPRHVNKQGAKKTFEKLKPNEELLGRMLEAIGKQKESEQWTKDNGQYIPHPQTWLNGRRWEDELPRAKMRVLPAQDFSQRDYSGVQDELNANLAKEMAAFKAGQEVKA